MHEQLQPEDRMTIGSMKQQGCSVRAMGRMLNRSAATISCELVRNTGAGQACGSHVALQNRQASRRAAKPACQLALDSVTWGAVLTMLDWKWSTQQIAAGLQRDHPNESTRRVSHETICTAINARARGELRRQLIACLRFGKGPRLPLSRCTDRRGQIPDMVSIRVRPPEMEDRVMPVRRERDFIKGADNKSSVGVLVERSSRLGLALAGSFRPDLVRSDVYMHPMGVLGFIKYLRTHANIELRKVTALMTRADSSNQTLREAVPIGIASYIIKPPQISGLKAKLEPALKFRTHHSRAGQRF